MKNPLMTAYRAIEKRVLLNADVRLLNVMAVAKGANAPSSQLAYEAESMQRQTLKEWTQAYILATDPENPDKTALDRLYKNLMLDNHLASIIDSRILFCQRSPFKIVNEAGDENTDVSWLFERTWFEEIRFLMSTPVSSRRISFLDSDGSALSITLECVESII